MLNAKNICKRHMQPLCQFDRICAIAEACPESWRGRGGVAADRDDVFNVVLAVHVGRDGRPQ
jgi:hypothetical protein